MRVGKEVVYLEEGKSYVFDDSFEHEVFLKYIHFPSKINKAWHEGEETRIILIVDFWHPDLTNEEVRFLTLLRNSKMRFFF